MIGLPELFAAGFSMGGNLVLKMAGEFGDSAPEGLRGVAAVAPSMELASCAARLEEPANFLYEMHFVRRLKRRMHQKASLFPQRYPLDGLHNIRTVREFDDIITARFCGFRDAADYYEQSSAAQLLRAISRPTLIVAAEDDPVVPFAAFENAAIRENPNITLYSRRGTGGIAPFISRAGRRREILVRGANRRILQRPRDGGPQLAPEDRPRCFHRLAAAMRFFARLRFFWRAELSFQDTTATMTRVLAPEVGPRVFREHLYKTCLTRARSAWRYLVLPRCTSRRLHIGNSCV